MVLFNSRDTKYKKPFGAVATGEVVEITFPVSQKIKASEVYLIIRNHKAQKLHLNKIAEENGYDIFNINFNLNKAGIYFYRFEIKVEEGLKFVGKDKGCKAKIEDWLPEWQLTVYDEKFKTPDFIKGGIIYHIFVDRFAKAGETVKPRYGVSKDWSEDITIADNDGRYRANDFYGGNFQGIISKLDYLKSLNVTMLYLSPIFESSSNHRYDTGDYFKIDSVLGTEEDFKELIKKAKEKGIYIMLDGVFNHTGSDSVYFNKDNHYSSVGAYQGKESPYYNWYTFLNDKDYLSWWGIKNVPTIRWDALGFQDMIAGQNGVLEKWTKLGVVGWRLDVVDELSIPFVKKIREKIKELSEDNLIIGEVWEDATTKESYGQLREYFLGNELDGVMNYPFKESIISFMKTRDIDAFILRVMDIIDNYPKAALDVSMSLLSTHDTIRIINALSEADIKGLDKKGRKEKVLTEKEYNKGKKRLMLASFLQYFLPGVPSVYYGDEIGMQGYEDPINRRPFSLYQDNDILEHYINLGKMRAERERCFCANIQMKKENGLLVLKRGNLKAYVNVTGQDISINKIFEKEKIYDIITKKDIKILCNYRAVVFNDDL